MATQALTQKTLSKAGFISTTGANWQTMTSGAGNGSVVAMANANFLALYNDTIGSVVYTIKAAQTAPYSGRSITLPDMTVTVAADGFGKIACISKHTLD